MEEKSGIEELLQLRKQLLERYETKNTVTRSSGQQVARLAAVFPFGANLI